MENIYIILYYFILFSNNIDFFIPYEIIIICKNVNRYFVL